jgi:predicted RNA-binding protein with PUA-like domain
MSCWLVKSEPHKYSIDDLRRDKTTLWTGVRNYQARNFLRAMQVGDSVLYYHSVTEPPGVIGIATVKATAVADPSQFESDGEYFDEKATPDEPRWFAPRLGYVRSFSQVIARKDMLSCRQLEGLECLKPRSRLSVHPVSEAHFRFICDLAS